MRLFGSYCRGGRWCRTNAEPCNAQTCSKSQNFNPRCSRCCVFFYSPPPRVLRHTPRRLLQTVDASATLHISSATMEPRVCKSPAPRGRKSCRDLTYYDGISAKTSALLAGSLVERSPAKLRHGSRVRTRPVGRDESTFEIWRAGSGRDETSDTLDGSCRDSVTGKKI